MLPLVFFAICFALLLWDSGGQLDLLSGFVLALVVIVARHEIRRWRNAGSRWAESGPAIQKRGWLDVASLIALVLALLSIPLAAWYRLPEAPSIVVFVVLMIALGVREYGRREHRISAIKRWCVASGHRFYERGYSEIKSKLEGRRLAFWNMNAAPAVLGQYEGLSFLAYEYHRKERDGTHERGTFVVLRPGRELLPLEIHRRRPDESRDDGAQFELEAFNEAFRIEAKDERWAFDALGQESMARLLDGPRFDEIRLGGEGLVVLHRTPLQPEGIESALELAHFLLRSLPVPV